MGSRFYKASGNGLFPGFARGASGPALAMVDVIQLWGESNDVGARNSLTALPNGYYATDNNVFVWDDADLLGSGQAALGTVEEVITAPVLSRLFGTEIQVVHAEGHIFVMSRGRDVEHVDHQHDDGHGHAHHHH